MISCRLVVFFIHSLHPHSLVVHENPLSNLHYDDVTMSGMASQITSFTIVYSTVYPGADQRKHESPASLAFVRGIHRGPVNSPHKWPVTRKLFPFDDVIMFKNECFYSLLHISQSVQECFIPESPNSWTEIEI